MANGKWSYGQWGECSIAEGDCKPGSANCNSSTCKCNSGYTYKDGACQPNLVCKIGAKQKQTCANNPKVVQERTFGADGKWSSWTPNCQ
jgi:hypothetical protein